jgi:hypothetical protein
MEQQSEQNMSGKHALRNILVFVVGTVVLMLVIKYFIG